MPSPDQIITQGLVAVFTHPGAALMLSGALFACCVALLLTAWFNQVRPLVKALGDRLGKVGSLVATGSAEKARTSFARNQEAISDAMLARGPQSYVLQRAWLDYQQSFVDDDGVLASSARAGVFFGGAGDPGRAMDWWANIFVAVGLMLTFLGIVAALTQATQAIGAGQDSEVMQAALASLLGIAAAKFWTSIAGVGSSLVLRMYGRRWRTRLERLEDELCEVLDAGVRHVSPQALALRQLSELQRLNALLARSLGADPVALPSPGERGPAPVASLPERTAARG